MSYQAIAFDLDGTLLSSQGTILNSSKFAIQQAQQKGLKVFIVTGRHHTAVRPYYAELGLDTPVVCCNGTYLYDFQKDEVLAAKPLTTEQASYLISSAKAEHIHTAVYTRDSMTYEVLNTHFNKLLTWVNSCDEKVRPDVHQVSRFEDFLDGNTLIWKVLISDPDRQKMQNFVEKLPLDQFSAEWSWVDRVDITAQGNSKGACLAELLKREGIDPKNVIAFGDNFNDISMLQLVGMGIAMGESESEVQQSAKKTIGSNNEDSIARELTQLLSL
ncbi:pyridoxal phosphatase [Ursidibacter maritimus]|uniref:Pyridoxal phosphatase n=1 Tax=Ursidibacter maritimus TaxID=1331689 RepID=A0A949SY72_9PAST|nr:pyridoxal phosphatase [Ursidibacter maritimus]KAE9541386.1 HAD family hydrolase [Ursidibacter maritimus]MBV6524830.1 pyridoxal phosphatase [Ursidibacter maritimus]MBV6526091.1 pyridoxal phosphatase [Ursidibacter maritimus]MBV6527131.1 pyridoxal phosphatase [Ursidibacter maritimus]MBV6529034.1 pyridoxal phosphatase [Ursidibacter maritimus]